MGYCWSSIAVPQELQHARYPAEFATGDRVTRRRSSTLHIVIEARYCDDGWTYKLGAENVWIPEAALRFANVSGATNNEELRCSATETVEESHRLICSSGDNTPSYREAVSR